MSCPVCLPLLLLHVLQYTEFQGVKSECDWLSCVLVWQGSLADAAAAYVFP